MATPADSSSPFLYEGLATHVASLIETGALRGGDRLPSVRRLAQQRHVSVATVVAAYQLLEARQLVETRPKSGHFVARRPMIRPVKAPAKVRSLAPTAIRVCDAVASLTASMGDPSVVPLGAACLSEDLYPIRTLNRILIGMLREMGTAGAQYVVPPGLLTLRRQLARRSLSWGMALSEDDFVITSGAMEAIHLSLRAVARAGDSVAVSSPCYFGILQLLEEMEIRVIEIPSQAEGGMDLSVLEMALRRHNPRACIAIPSFDNPTGALMGPESRQRLFSLLERHDIPLIEDDVYGDLAWDGSRPSPVKALDRSGRVLLCSSVSKTIAAGYRLGWVVPGRYQTRVERLKFSQSVATSTLEQMAIAEYLSTGGYDRHLRTLRRKLSQQVSRYRATVAQCFPQGTALSDPGGGFFLWIQLPHGVDAMRLQLDAAHLGIAVAPGPIFTARGGFRSCIRLNCGFPWSPAIEDAVRTLGGLASRLVVEPPPRAACHR